MRVFPMSGKDLLPRGMIRESGMPAEDVWGGFFDVEETLNRVQVDSRVVNAADFACGYGTFTIPAAQRISGTMYAVDIDPGMARIVERKARGSGLSNVRLTVSDLLREGSGLEDESVDYAMLFNILHTEEPQTLLREAFRVLRPRGRVGIIHWVRDASTPRGPPLAMRPTPEQCEGWCREAGFTGSVLTTELKPYHFGFVAGK